MESFREIERSEQKTIITKVEFDFDGVLVECDISHFMPGSEDDIQRGIENRMVSEKRKLENPIL